MLLKFGFLSLILLLIACSSNNTKVEEVSESASLNYSMELKHLVSDSIASGEFTIIGKWISQENKTVRNCQNCQENDRSCCVVVLNGRRYIRDRSFVLNEIGKVDSVYSYHVPEGVNCYAIQDFLELFSPDAEETEQLTNGRIYWDNKSNAVIDNEDTVTALKMDRKGGYLYKQEGRVLIQYEFKR